MDDLLTSEFTRDQFVSIAYHWYSTSDPYDTAQVTDKGVYYGVTAAPWNFFDGKYGCPTDGYPGCRGAGTTVKDYYRDSINSRLAVDSPIRLSISGRLDSDEGFVIVEAEALDRITATDHVIRIAVLEDNIYYSAGSYPHNLRYVFRYHPLDESISLANVGDTWRTARWFKYGAGWNPAEISVVAFVQQDSDKEVEQGIFFDGTPTEAIDPMPITAMWSTAMPTIDGTVDPGEWSGATETFVDLAYYVNFPYYIYTMNDDNYLYVLLDAVGDASSSGSHYAGLYFDTQEDGIFTRNEEDAVECFAGGSVYYKNWDGTTWANVSSSASGVPFSGGSHDEDGLIGAYGYGTTPRGTSDHHFYEFKIPLIMGEINAAPGDAKKLYMYLLGKGEESYWSPHADYADPTTYGDLTLATGSATIPDVSIIGLVIIMAVLTAGLVYKFIR